MLVYPRPARGWGGTLAAVAVILLSIVTALGLTGWLGIRLTPPSASAPLIILTVAVADTIHILTNFLAALRQGLGKQDAMVESLRINLQPVFLTSLTTAVGFLSMNFSDAPPFRDLGNMVAMGVVAAFFISVAFLPAVMMLLPVKPPPQAAGLPWMQRFGDFVVARRRALLPIMGVLIAGLVVFVPRNELNDVFVHYFDERVPFRVASEFANDHLSGIYRVDYSLRADQSGGISEPYFLQRMAAFAEWLREQPGVTHVNTLTDIFKRLNKNLHGDDPSFYRVPEERELAAQYLLLYEMSLPYGLDLNNQINVDKSAARLNVGIEIMSVQELLALQERARDWLAVNWPEVDSEGSGPTVMFSHLGKRNIQSMLLGTTIALVLISGILLLALRSVKMGLVSLMPNLVPAGMAFGLWGLLIGEVGISLSVVTAMTLGIVVDDTVHFLSKYLRARRDHGSSPADAVRYAFSTVGSALLITSVVLIAGFSVLALSSFWLNAGMGLLTAITIGFALIADFLFLPPLLMKVEEKAHEASIRDTAPKPASA